jgi:type III secretory pathway lipoprotein EscJ
VPYAEAARNRLALKHQLKEAVQGIDRGIFGVQVRVALTFSLQNEVGRLVSVSHSAAFRVCWQAS